MDKISPSHIVLTKDEFEKLQSIICSLQVTFTGKLFMFFNDIDAREILKKQD